MGTNKTSTIRLGMNFSSGEYLVTPEDAGTILEIIERSQLMSGYTTKEFPAVTEGLYIKTYTVDEINQLKMEAMLTQEGKNE